MREEASYQRQPEQAKAARTVWCDDGLGVIEFGCVCIVAWRAPVTPQRFRVQRASLDNFIGRHSGEAGLIITVQPGAPPPEEKMRKASIEMIAGFGSRLRCLACVFEGGGFKAAASRSVLHGMSLLLPRPKPEMTFTATVQLAAPWVARHCSGVTAADLVRTHEQLCKQLDESSAHPVADSPDDPSDE